MPRRDDPRRDAYARARDAEALRVALVTMLNMLGDRTTPCPSNDEGCEGCEADAAEAMRHGLASLGYSTWAEFHKQEILHGAGP